ATFSDLTIDLPGAGYSLTFNSAMGGSSFNAGPFSVIAPATIAPPGPLTIPSGGSVTLTASAGVSWQWTTGDTTQAISVSSARTYSVTVTDAGGCSSTSPGVIVTIGLAPTSTTLASNKATSLTTSPAIFTATVSLSTATGQVQFFDNGTVLGAAPVFLRNGNAVAVWGGASLSTGSHSITATYAGDANDQPSSSAAVSEIVEPETDFAIDLGPLPGGAYSTPQAGTDSGLVTGDGDDSAGQTHGFLWAAGSMTDLGTLGGSYTNAVAINAAGAVIGGSTTAGGPTDPFVYSGGVLTDIGVLSGSGF